MNKVAFTIFGLDILWYGILISFGVLVGTVLAIREAKRVGYKEDDILDLLIWVLPAAIVGARLYYVIFNAKYYMQNPLQILNVRTGGLAIHGGVFGAFIVGYFYVNKKKLSFWKMADIVAPSLILGQAIGRWGNFINQEAYGGAVSYEYISKFPKFIQNQMYIQGQYYHPTFLYESLWNLVIFAGLVVYRRNKKVDGEVIALYAIFYSIGRFFIEGLRTDSLMLGPLRIAQVVSITLMILGFFIFILRRKTKTSR